MRSLIDTLELSAAEIAELVRLTALFSRFMKDKFRNIQEV